MLAGSLRTIPHPTPERIHFARCRACRGFGIVTLPAGDMGHDFTPMAVCGDRLRCGDKVAGPPGGAA